jgi:hypothetical protein
MSQLDENLATPQSVYVFTPAERNAIDQELRDIEKGHVFSSKEADRILRRLLFRSDRQKGRNYPPES